MKFESPLLTLMVILQAIPLAGLLYVVYFILTIPMRRRERARVFLDIVDLGLKDGQSPEVSIAGAGATRDPSLPFRFHVLAREVRNGRKLGDALARVPTLLDPQITAMIRVGEKIGNIAAVLPACRHVINDGVSQVRSALNYLPVLLFVATPFTLVIPVVVSVVILPRYKEIFNSMGGGSLPGLTRLVFDHGGLLLAVQSAVLAVVWFIFVLYAAGPHFRGFLSAFLHLDRIAFFVPWRRKRLQRDFSSMLSILLDAGLPEADAVNLAAEATSNSVFRDRATLVNERLRNGERLSTAIRVMDDSGELRWRLANALERGGGFLPALSGWHEALDARAFQLEQSAAQLATSALVLLNGLIVGVVVISVMLPLVNLLNQITLW